METETKTKTATVEARTRYTGYGVFLDAWVTTIEGRQFHAGCVKLAGPAVTDADLQRLREQMSEQRGVVLTSPWRYSCIADVYVHPYENVRRSRTERCCMNARDAAAINCGCRGE